MVKEPIAYRIEYADGLKATVFMMNGLIADFAFAAKLKNRSQPLSTLFYLNDVPNVVHFAQLMSQFERMVVTEKAPYPVERTLLTSGLIEANLKSLSEWQRRIWLSSTNRCVNRSSCVPEHALLWKTGSTAV